MANKQIEIEADSLEKAREKVQEQIPNGQFLLSEKILSDGKKKNNT